MASDLSDIVQVSVTVESAFPSRLGFGQPVIMTAHTKWADSYRIYSNLIEMAADGFSSADEAYRLARGVFSQNPTVTSVVVGKMDPSAAVNTAELTITSAVEGQTVSFTIMEPATGTLVPVSYTIPAASTTTTVATAVELLVEAVAGVTSSAALAVITLGTDTAGLPIRVGNLVNCTFEDTTVSGGYDDALTALREENDDWYLVLIGSQGAADIAEVAAWTESNEKLFFWQRSDSSLLDGTDTAAAALQSASYKKTVGIYHGFGYERADAAWVGVGAPQDPGSITWALKQLSGVQTDNLSSTAKNNLSDVNVNYYINKRGRGVVLNGVVAEGEWIDVIHGIDALVSRVQEDVFGLLASAGKIPYSDSGINMVANVTSAAVRFFEGSREQPGLLLPGSTSVTVPKRSAVSAADVASRILRNVNFTAKLSGAIHHVIVVGQVSY